MQQFATEEELLSEIYKCGKNPAYFIKSYCKIMHPQRGLISFKTWDFQDKLLEDYVDYDMNIILKSRQLGISTLTAAYCAWLMIFHRAKNIIVVATQFDVAQNLVLKVKDMIKALEQTSPFLLELANIEVDNRTTFTLTNGSKIKAFATNQTVGRSEAASLVVLDEAAHIEGLDDLWTALEPTMAAGGRCIALSSPNGHGNWFYDQYKMAEKSDNDFHPTKLMWYVHPERGPFRKDEKGNITSDWWEKVKKKTNRRQRAQEYECAFNASGETVVDPEDIMYIEEETSQEPNFRIGFDRNLWVWKQYEAGKNYMLLADTARGDGEDYSAFHVLEVESMEQVAEYHGQLSTDMFARLIADTGRDYGDAMVVPENNTLGHEVCNKLIEFEYPNIYFHEKGTHIFVEHHKAPYMNNVVAGFTTSLKTRPLIVTKLEEYIRNDLIIIRSRRTSDELRTFIWKNGRPEAQQGKNDDLIIPLAIGCWIRDTIYEKNQKDAAFKRVSLTTMRRADTKLDTTIPGQATYRPNLSLFKRAQQQQQERKQFSWLFTG